MLKQEVSDLSQNFISKVFDIQNYWYFAIKIRGKTFSDVLEVWNFDQFPQNRLFQENLAYDSLRV